MEKYATELFKRTTTRLETKVNKDENILNRSSQSIKILEDSMNELKDFISKYSFKDEAEEILFFKEIKPQLFSMLIYHNKVYNIECVRPTESIETQKVYLKLELTRLKRFFDRNRELYKYHRAKFHHLDQYYYLRRKPRFRLNHDSFYFESDPAFSTSFDYKIAKILANEMLSNYLNEEIVKLELEEQHVDRCFPKIKLTWTGKKSELIELIYALIEANTFNNGMTNIKELTEYFEIIFNVELKDYYRTFLEIRNRKDDRTAFLTKLTQVLIFRMDAADHK